MRLDRPIVLVGCGKMGGALLAGWLAQGLARDRVRVVEPAEDLARAIADTHGVAVVAKPDALDAGLEPAVVLVAVKPQKLAEALPAYRAYARPGTLVLSIAAGRTIASFARVLGAGTPIVRAMPNTPAAVGRGITVAVANAAVSPAMRTLAGDLLGAVGEVLWTDDESLIDPVTALSGGGPAYVFLLIETLARAGEKVGLPSDMAWRLARSTVIGAGELARRSDETAEQLRKNVTSPGGTTIEAIKILMAEDGVQPLFDRALAAATRRGRELAE